MLLRTNGGAAASRPRCRDALAGYPNVQVQTRAQFQQSQVSSVNQLLGLVYALLALAVIIALIGIVNTLMLSVLERTREIGLLRAVGMRRRQVRSMIRSEAVILAIFGALIGIVVGTLMGLALVSALRQQGITDTVVPVSSLIIFLVLAAVLGLIAASWPAWPGGQAGRAGRHLGAVAWRAGGRHRRGGTGRAVHRGQAQRPGGRRGLLRVEAAEACLIAPGTKNSSVFLFGPAYPDRVTRDDSQQGRTWFPARRRFRR